VCGEENRFRFAGKRGTTFAAGRKPMRPQLEPDPMTELPARLARFAQALIAARRTRSLLPSAPQEGCATTADSYAVQAEVASALGASVTGWKVGFGPEGQALAAPIFTTDMIGPGDAYRLGGDGRTVKAEAELALRLGRDLPSRPGRPYTRDEILAATAQVLCGLELVATRFAQDTGVSFEDRLADNFAHGAYAAGDGVGDLAGLDLTQLACTVRRDGAVVFDGPAAHAHGDPLVPAIAWANGQCDRLGGLRAGQFITTGTLIAPITIDDAATIEAQLTGIGAARLAVSR